MDARNCLLAIRAKGLTQMDVSKQTGISQGTISKIECGQVANGLARSYIALMDLHGRLERSEMKSAPEPEARAA